MNYYRILIVAVVTLLAAIGVLLVPTVASAAAGLREAFHTSFL